ncbi:MAG: PDZ domain-containing protein, partial [Acidobacteriota bacterium]|nr:PDZ domain-containing protein [Acidobacteriota bacterium]
RPRPAAAAPEVSYVVSMPRPYTHLLRIDMSVRAAADAPLPAQLDLVMPVWTPGSYLIREYERNVQDFSAEGLPSEAGIPWPLNWTKTNKDTWRVETKRDLQARVVHVSYNVYANDFSVRTDDLNDRHAFWNNAATLMYVDGFLGAPATVRVVPAQGWKIATGLPAVAGKPDTFRAENYDILYDSPFLVSDFKVLSFEVRGVQHRIVIDGEGNYDPERVRRDVQKIVEAEVNIFDDIPYHDYTFLLMLDPTRGGGGTEHLNSTALTFRRFGFQPEAGYRSFLTLVSHEFFHLWNVKRIRPDALGPFDYTRENYTRLLWVAEGITSYYENLNLRRAGLITDRQYLDEIARAIRSMQNTPGRREMSAEESSFDAWIKQYRPDENSINSSVSYYDKGALLGLLLDLEIRRRTAGAHALDDVMRLLYNDYYKRGRNYTPEDFQHACEAVAGSSLEEFFSNYVRGRKELDYNAAFSAVGLQLEPFAGERRNPAGELSYFGATLAQTGDRLNVTNVLAGSPAYEQGLNANDQIVAIDGARATLDFLNARLNEHKPGDEIRVTVFRNDDLRTLTIKLGARPPDSFRIAAVKNPTPDQARLYEQWMGAPLQSLK